jgi:hypothetical protein
MRFKVPVTAVGLCLMPLGMLAAAAGAPQQAASQQATRQPATPQPATPQPATYNASPADTVPTSAATTDGVGSDAAARHAKRTACLKEAKAKRLVGADKNSFIKDCIATR